MIGCGWKNMEWGWLYTVVGILFFFLLFWFYSWFSLRSIQAQFPALGEYMEVAGVRVHYVSEGVGPPIVLLHGANSTHREFTSSIGPLLGRAHRVIAIDRPGYGESTRGAANAHPTKQVEIIHNLLDKLGIQSSVIVGHSLGGAVALAYALEFPEKTAGLVLIGGVAYPWKTGVAWYNHVAHWPVIGPVFLHTLLYPLGRLLLPGVVNEVFAPARPPEGYQERSASLLALRPGPFRASAEDLIHLSEHMEVQSQRYDELTLPLALITGTQDKVVFPGNHSHRLAERLAQARLIEMDGVGHVPHQVHPEEVANFIANFTARTQQINDIVIHPIDSH